MNNQQKIELGKYIIGMAHPLLVSESHHLKTGSDVIKKISELTEKDIAAGLEVLASGGKRAEIITGYLEISDDVKIIKTDNSDKVLVLPIASVLTCDCGTSYNSDNENNSYACGVCYKRCCNFCIVDDFEICPICTHAGKIKIRLHDKNGAIFQSGDILRNKNSLTTSVKILQINDTHIVSEPGGLIEIQDFIDAGWIVHERVTPYRKSGRNFLSNI